MFKVLCKEVYACRLYSDFHARLSPKQFRSIVGVVRPAGCTPFSPADSKLRSLLRQIPQMLALPVARRCLGSQVKCDSPPTPVFCTFRKVPT